MKIFCIHHNKDLDGFTSGAIVKRAFPDCELIGWDYKDDIPDFERFRGSTVIMIDITFPVEKMVELSKLCELTVIDHHISPFRDLEKIYKTESLKAPFHPMMVTDFLYVYKDRAAACEIGWEFFFPNVEMPYAVKLLGRYDTWRQEEGDWEGETLPFQYYMRTEISKPEDFEDTWFFSERAEKEEDLFLDEYESNILDVVNKGISILKYQSIQDQLACERSAFERTIYGGLRGLCLNARAFSSNTMSSIYDPNKHDIMIGFEYAKDKWGVSLRSTKDDVDVSLIAKARGGGGHKAAAGFEVDSFDKIFE